MSDLFEALYYDGMQSKPHPVYITYSNGNVRVFDYQNNLIAEQKLSDATVSETAGQLYIYLNTQKTSFAVLPPAHPLIKILQAEHKESDSTWFAKLMRQKILLLASIILLLGVGFYCFAIFALPNIALKLITPKQETKIGKQFFDLYIQDKSEDSSATVYLQQFADKMHLTDKYQLHAYVVYDAEVNAFALPGGYIIVNTGILKKMKSYEELAALLGHEVTHINERHSLRSMLGSISTSIFLSIITGDASGITAFLVNNAEQLRQLSFSRKLEQEADDASIQIMIKNNINPRGMISLMKRLQEEEDVKVPELLSSHPLTEDRIANAKAKTAGFTNKKFESRKDLEVAWDSMLK